MITPEETAELDRLLAEATPKPWSSYNPKHAKWPGVEAADVSVVVWGAGYPGFHEGDDIGIQGHTQDEAVANAALIVFLRNHAPALLAVARQAEAKDARIAELEAALRETAALAGEDEGNYHEGSAAAATLACAARLADPSPNAGGGGAG